MTRFLITGVTRGVGAALMSTAHGLGHEVVKTTQDGRYGTIALEFWDPGAITARLGHLSPIDVFINNAWIIVPTSQLQTWLSKEWARMAEKFAINSISPSAVAQAALPALGQSERHHILTVSSQTVGFARPKSSQIAYRASKAPVNKEMQGLAVEPKPERIPVAVINHGWVRTAMGGPEAEEDATDVAHGILAIADRPTIEDTGKFFWLIGGQFLY